MKWSRSDRIRRVRTVEMKGHRKDEQRDERRNQTDMREVC